MYPKLEQNFSHILNNEDKIIFVAPILRNNTPYEQGGIKKCKLWYSLSAK